MTANPERVEILAALTGGEPVALKATASLLVTP